MSTMNRLFNIGNRYQGEVKRVLCVCSAGLLRSPTIAWVLGDKPYYFNTRAVGYSEEYALIPLDQVVIQWADEIVCADDSAYDAVTMRFKEAVAGINVYNWRIPDRYPYRTPELVKTIETKAKETWPNVAVIDAFDGVVT